MNNWMADPFPYPGQAARPRQGPADEGGARGPRREVQGVRPLPRRRRRRHPVPHAARASSTRPAAAYFTRGSGHTDRAHVHRAARRLQEQHGPARAEVRDGAKQYVPKPVVSDGIRRARSASSPTAPRTSPSRRRARSSRRKGVDDRLPAPARAALHARDRRVHRRPRPRLRRRPEPRRPDVRPAATRGRRATRPKLRSIRHYDGFPLDAETVIEGIEAGEKN